MFKQISIPPGKLLFRCMRGCKCIHLWQPYRWDNPLYRAQIKAPCVGNMFSLFSDELSSRLSPRNTSFHFSIQCLCGKPMLSLLLNDCEGAVVFPHTTGSACVVHYTGSLSFFLSGSFCSKLTKRTLWSGFLFHYIQWTWLRWESLHSACRTSSRPPFGALPCVFHDGGSQREPRGCWWALFWWPYLCCRRRPSFRPCRPVNVHVHCTYTTHRIYVETYHIWNRAVSQCDRKWKLRKWHQEVIQPPSIDVCAWASGQWWWNMERIPAGRRGLYTSKHWLS